MYRASYVRTALRLFLAAFIVSQAQIALAQTVSDPGVVEFDPSADHSRVASDGTSLVREYLLSVYISGQSSPFTTASLGKPSPQSDGKIRVGFLSLISPLSPGVMYEARVAASGPGGTAASVASNQFQFSAPCTTALSANTLSAGSGAGTGSVNVTSPPGCTWTSSSNTSWLAITTGAASSGSTTVAFSIAANTTQSVRTGTMTIAGGTFTVTQAATSCSYALSANSQSLPSAGGTGSVTMTATNGCAWTASSSAAWLTVTSGASGNGSATVAFNAAANTDTTARTATLNIAGQTFTVMQPGVSCSYTLSPNTASLTTAGGPGSIVVTAPTGCAWSATSAAPWLTISSGATGNGPGTVAYSAAINTTLAPRTGTLTIGGQAASIASDNFNRGDGAIGSNWADQKTDSWPIVANMLSIANNAAVGVPSDFVCSSWNSGTNAFGSNQASQATIVALGPSDALFVTVRSSGTSVAGNFSTYLLAADAPGSPYSTLDKIVNGTQSHLLNLNSVSWAPGDVVRLSVVGQTLSAYKNGVLIGTVTDTDLSSGQPGACIYDGTSDGITTSFDSWSGDAGGPPAPAPSGSQSFTATQAGVNCTYGLSAASGAFTSAGGTGSVAVTATGGCAWTATSSAPWLTVTSGATGSGPGTVAFGATANSSTSPRMATLTVASQTYTVTQSGVSCSFSISATSQAFPAAGGAGSVGVTTPTGCVWTTSSNASWLTVSSGSSASGSGQVTFSASANTNTTARMATLTVAGNAVAVTQAAATCSYAISPATQTVPSPGGSGSIAVMSATGCAWTASSGAPWLTVTAGASGSGDGAVTFSAAANATTTTRAGTLSIGGKTFTVTQPGTACTYSVSPMTLSMSSSGGTASATVLAGNGCAWSVTSNAAWLTPGVGSGGTGSGAVAFTASSNTSSSIRTGTLVVAGQVVTVTQSGAGGCSMALSSTSRSLNSKGGSGSISVTNSGGCSWTAISSVSWITVTGVSVSTGTVTYTVSANTTGASRTGTIVIGGVTFTVTQRADSSPNPPSRLRVVSSGN
jgi:hypothetical protein